MNEDSNHCTSKFTALPEMLKPLGYKTHALGSKFNPLLLACADCENL